jgi:hypothetical protein
MKGRGVKGKVLVWVGHRAGHLPCVAPTPLGTAAIVTATAAAAAAAAAADADADADADSPYACPLSRRCRRRRRRHFEQRSEPSIVKDGHQLTRPSTWVV